MPRGPKNSSRFGEASHWSTSSTSCVIRSVVMRAGCAGRSEPAIVSRGCPVHGRLAPSTRSAEGAFRNAAADMLPYSAADELAQRVAGQRRVGEEHRERSVQPQPRLAPAVVSFADAVLEHER